MGRDNFVGTFCIHIVMNYPAGFANQTQYTHFNLSKGYICFILAPKLLIQGYTSTCLMHLKRQEGDGVGSHHSICSHTSNSSCKGELRLQLQHLSLHYYDFYFPSRLPCMILLSYQEINSK